MYDQLKEAGVPVPESYSATALTGVEETAAVHLMAIRLGDIVATFCPCEQFTDTALNIESRLDRVEGNICKGFDWTEQKTPAGRDWCVPDAATGTWTCANPRNPAPDLAPITDVAYRRFRAQINNDAAGWETDLATLGSEAEPADPAKIKGNFTHEEHAEHGYRLVLPSAWPTTTGATCRSTASTARTTTTARRSPASARTAPTSSPRGCRGWPRRSTAARRSSSRRSTSRSTAEEARAQGLADGLGELARAYTTAYERTLPADGGTPAVVDAAGATSRASTPRT